VICLKKVHITTAIYKVVVANNSKMLDLWLQHIVFSWRWWFQLGLSIIPWIIWIKIRDKNNTVRLLFIGFIIMLISNTLDIMGLCYGLWYYDWKVLPLTPVYFPWDFTLFPVSFMLLMQYKPKVNRFIKAFGFSFIISFIVEPFFSWLSIYEPLKWKFWYSFISYFLLYLAIDKINNCKLFKN
jgi:hypothetical protein